MTSFAAIGFIVVATALVGNQGFDSLRIGTPGDKEKYASGSNCFVGGALYLPDRKPEDVKSLLVVTRLYKPIVGNLVIVAEKVGNPGKAVDDRGVYPFEADFNLSQEPGRYLLRADCFDPRIEDDRNSLIASQSIFLDIAASAELPNQQHSQTHTVTINTATTTTNFGTGSDITVAGSSNPVVAHIRIRFYKGDNVIQEKIVAVQSGTPNTFSGTLSPPTGGWPVNNADIAPRGLDSSYGEVASEIDVNSISVN